VSSDSAPSCILKINANSALQIMSKISNQSQCSPIICNATLASWPCLQFLLFIQDRPIMNFLSFLQNNSIQQNSSWIAFRLPNYLRNSSDLTKSGVHFSSEISATWPYHQPQNQIHAITSHFFKFILILSFHLLLLHRH